jgi:uroporphyrinogen III methyltransferase/synthase
MVRLLRDAGAEILEIPTIEICDPESWDTVDEAMDNVASFQWLAFASPNSVDRFITRLLKRGGDIRALSGIKIATIGPATTKRVEAYHLCAAVTPEDHRAEGLAAALLEETSEDDRVLYPRAEGGRDVVPVALSESGIEVVDVVVYRTTKPSTTPQVAMDRFREGRVDLVTFTSSSTVRHFDALMADAGLSDKAKGIPSASIGPTTSAAIRDLGYNLAVQSPADEISVEALVTEILKYVSK